MARGLARQRTRTLGMVALNIANPFWPAVVRGVEDAARERGYELLLANSDDDAQKEARCLRLFLAKRVDGILLTKACGRLPADLKAQLNAANIPLVQLMRVAPGLRSDIVTVDEEGGTYQAVAHLLRLGYARIGMLNGPNVISPSAASRAIVRPSPLHAAPTIRRSSSQATSGWNRDTRAASRCSSGAPMPSS